MKEPRSVAADAALGTALDKSKGTPVRSAAQAGKAVAMWPHNYVVDNVDVTQAAFARNHAGRSV